jgi:hypothetical protein
VSGVQPRGDRDEANDWIHDANDICLCSSLEAMIDTSPHRPINCIVLTTFNVVKGRHMSPN